MAFLLVLAAYGAAMVLTYRRWRWYGPVGLALLVAIVCAAWGTWDWHRPHTDYVKLPPLTDWQCHSLDVLPWLIAFTAAGLVALRLVRPLSSKVGAQLFAVALSFTVIFFPAALLELYVTVQVMACDTL
jgi:hypothetical protein